MRPSRATLIGLAVLAALTVALVAAAVAKPALDRPAAQAPSTGTVPPATHTVLFQAVGDSYTGGSDIGGTGNHGWANLVATGHKGTSAVLLDKVAEGGAGYASKGQTGTTVPQFYAANAHPGQNVVTVFAGLNDKLADPAAVGNAAAGLYAAIHKESPKAALIVVGPAWPNQTPTENILAVRDAIKAAATAAGAVFVDPIGDGWFMGADHRLIGADGTHPTDEGHRYMAAKLAPVIDAAIERAGNG